MFKNTPTFSGYSVDNVETALEFYGETLGITVSQSPEGLTLQLAGGNTVFLYPKSDHTPATFTVLNFVVEHIDEAVDALTQKGVIFEQYEHMTDEKGIARGIAAHRGPDIAWFKDPAGNFLAVLKKA